MVIGGERMYLYKIGYTSCEENGFWDLSHTEKFTQDDLTNMIAEAIVALKPEINNEYDYTKDLQEYFEHYEGDTIASWLIKNKGFKAVDFQEVWSGFGWASVFDIKDWDEYRHDTDKDLVKKVNELLRR